MISVDDAQWCDVASLRFLAYLVKRLEGVPVLVVMTVRTGDQGPDDTLLAELALEPVRHRAPATPAVARGGRERWSANAWARAPTRSSAPATG